MRLTYSDKGSRLIRVPFVEVILRVIIETLQMLLHLCERGFYTGQLLRRYAGTAGFSRLFTSRSHFLQTFAGTRKERRSNKANFLKFIEVSASEIVCKLDHHFRSVFGQYPLLTRTCAWRYLRDVNGKVIDTLLVIAASPSDQFCKRKVPFDGHRDGLPVEPVSVTDLSRQCEDRWNCNDNSCPPPKCGNPFSNAVLIGLVPRVPPGRLYAPRLTGRFPNYKDYRCDDQTANKPFCEPPLIIFHLPSAPSHPNSLTRTEGMSASQARVDNVFCCCKRRRGGK